MKKILLIPIIPLFLLVSTIGIYSQVPSSSKIYMPLDIRHVYEKGVRTYDGQPGKSFWQNTCNYKIRAEMNPSTGVITGKEWIEYKNNSPDTLKELLFNFYQDVYKKGSQRSRDIDVETKGIELGAMLINGDTIKEQDTQRSNTLCNVHLKKFVHPLSKINLEINWQVRIVEKEVAREGYVDSTSAFVGYWYPKIAVYDDLFGWNWNVYNLKDEFYSPLSTYDVSITLPKGFFVWATGKLLNQENHPDIIKERIKKAYTSGKVESIIDSTTNIALDQIGRDPWHFHADSVPDFAFGFSNHYLWDAVTLEVGNKKVLINTVYPKSQFKNFNGMTEVVKDAMYIYSTDNPGIMFPYPYFTSFYGCKAGMEFPMMSFDLNTKDKYGQPHVLVHEMLHSYVPFFLRTNETKFAWLDEGLTEFYTGELLRKLNYNVDSVMQMTIKNTSSFTKGFQNLPLNTLSLFTDRSNVRGMWYLKPLQMYTCLEDLLGADVWKKCFAAFVDTWKYKSPMTYDFIFFVENYTKRDLSWFWDAWFMHFGCPDLAIKSVDKDNVIIENKGGLPIPFILQTTDKNGKLKEVAYHADAWSKGKLFEIKLNTSQLSKIYIKCNLVPDANLKDNVWIR